MADALAAEGTYEWAIFQIKKGRVVSRGGNVMFFEPGDSEGISPSDEDIFATDWKVFHKPLSEFGRVGELLYGDRWKSPLARLLGTTYQTMLVWTKEGRGLDADQRALVVAEGVRRADTLDALRKDWGL